MTYWSAEVGPYVWHEFDTDRTRAELQAMADFGIRVVRTLLPWDAFMASPSRVTTARLRDVETRACLTRRTDERCPTYSNNSHRTDMPTTRGAGVKGAP